MWQASCILLGSSPITIHVEFDRADPSSMQDACHILTRLMALWPFYPWVLVAEWIEHLPGIQEVMGLSLVGDSDFSLSHAYDMLNQFTFNISLANLKFTIFICLSLLTTTSPVLILAGLRSSKFPTSTPTFFILKFSPPRSDAKHYTLCMVSCFCDSNYENLLIFVTNSPVSNCSPKSWYVH